MRNFLLTKIRLSWYFVIFFVIYLALALNLPRQAFSSAALALFSVNSFLYGFYISPIVSSQKGRIEELHKIVRNEANAIFAMVLYTKDLPKHLRNEIQDMFIDYLNKTSHGKHTGGEKVYEQMISFCLDYEGENNTEIDKLLDKLVANQQNRTMFAMQINNKVYSNEWVIMVILFAITLSFIILLDTGPTLVYRVVAALLSTGLTMLLVILVKLSTMTHKKARQIWQPFEKLLDSHFYRID